MSRAAEAAMTASYKALKEDFVSNLTGGTISEINLVTAVAPVSVILWSVLQSRQAFFKIYTPLAFAVDFALNVVAILLATTLYGCSPPLLNALLLGPAAIIYFLPPLHPKKAKLPPSSKLPKPESQNFLPKKPFLTTYRGAMMVITSIAILAVDFRIFPRRFAKVENWGTSLMDVGVGSFVFSAGVVGARPILKAQTAGTKTGLWERLYQSIRHSVPLLVLGFIRLWSVKGLDYAEHVTEYGVHWNFFFTLGFLPPFLALFQSAFEYVPSYALLSILLGSGYQLLLEFTSLKAYILTAPRVDLLSQNREGVFSFFGYLAIFLAGQGTGMFVLPRKILPSGSGWQQRKRLLLTLSAWSGVWVILFLGCTEYKLGLGLSVSRRLANLPYFLWISAFNTIQLLAFCAIETLFFPAVYSFTSAKKEEEEHVYKSSTSRILNAFNRNGLAVFLIANLGTGAVNMCIRTLDVKNGVAMGVLVGYAAVLTGVATALDVWDLDLRL